MWWKTTKVNVIADIPQLFRYTCLLLVGEFGRRLWRFVRDRSHWWWLLLFFQFYRSQKDQKPNQSNQKVSHVNNKAENDHIVCFGLGVGCKAVRLIQVEFVLLLNWLVQINSSNLSDCFIGSSSIYMIQKFHNSRFKSPVIIMVWLGWRKAGQLECPLDYRSSSMLKLVTIMSRLLLLSDSRYLVYILI